MGPIVTLAVAKQPVQCHRAVGQPAEMDRSIARHARGAYFAAGRPDGRPIQLDEQMGPEVKLGTYRGYLPMVHHVEG